MRGREARRDGAGTSKTFSGAGRVNVIERDGLSLRHPARFVLIGSGNPEEGELRPQLQDRFGLSVEVATPREIDARVEVVRRRDAYERDPAAFAAQWSKADAQVRRQILPRPEVDPEAFGRWSERFARFMGTPQFLVYMTAFVVIWLIWNTFGPQDLQFDPRALNYTLLTLILSLQASYAAPLILLAQNRQDDRDRVQFEQDRQRAERNLADTEYLAREVVALRLLVRDMASKDFIRAELRALLEELDKREVEQEAAER